jgi:glycogen debranching enzyme
LSISSSIDKEQAIKCAKESFSYRPRENNNRIQLNSNIKDIKVQYANYLSAQALRSLMLTNSSQRGIYAGLPWFTQFWTRDSAISCGALDIIGESSFVLELLNKYLSAIRPDGLIPNRLPNSELDSIDSVGLVFLRVSQMIEQFSDVQLSEIKNKLLQAIKSILVYHSNNDLIIAKPQETWMDTIQRTGARIEIQALQLNMYELLRKLSVKFKDKAAEEFAFNYKEKLTNTVRDEFFKDGQLYDGVEDNTPRPNVFLAYYFYPKMFTDKEWESIFDFALEALWLNWGGLATISTGSSQFTDKHTGVNNKSYHNGDSWFFVNNITALVLRRLNKNKYSKYIDKILSASTHEIIDLGVFGFHAEISSASQLESNGCIAQAWSSATYIELTKELFG